MITQDVLTTKEAMDYLRCTRPTLFKLIKEKKLKAFKVGQGYRILKEDLEKFIRGEG